MEADQVDLAATALGIVEKSAQIGSHRVMAGDVVIGLMSPNLRSNGFSRKGRAFHLMWGPGSLPAPAYAGASITI